MNKEELVTAIKAMTATADDKTALTAIELFPSWKESETVAVGDRKQYNGVLYKCVQAHTTQSDWTPDAIPSLWTVIDASHQGTIEDPIPASRGMEYEYGKYYSEGESIYLCERTGEALGGKIVLQYLPSELVGQYFTEA